MWPQGTPPGTFWRSRVRISATARLAELEFRLSDTSSFERFLAFDAPVFADSEFNRFHSGEWTTMTYGRSEARRVGAPDPSRLAYFGWYLRDRGRDNVVVEFTDPELVRGAVDGVVSFTFDDGYVTQLEAARLLAGAGYAATAYVMPRQIGEPGYLTVEQLSGLAREHRWEIASHHAVPFTEFSPAALEEESAHTIEALARLGFEPTARHLAYPLGKQNPEVVSIVRGAFASARLAGGGLETLPPADWHLLRAVNVMPGMSPEAIAALAARAQANGEWAILMFHHIVEAPRRDTDYRLGDFAALVRLLAERGVRVETVGEVWERLGGR